MLAGNTIYVGNKPAMRYVAVILSGFHDRKLDEVVLRARGSAISAAVDAAEIARNRFMPDLEPSVTIVTDQVEGEDGRKRSVSAMEIILRRSRGAQAAEERAALPLDGGVKCRQPERAEDARAICPAGGLTRGSAPVKRPGGSPSTKAPQKRKEDNKMRKGNVTILASIFIMALVALVGSVGTTAYFTDTATLVGHSFTAGTLDVWVSDPGLLPKAANMAPGETATGYLVIANTGSLDMLFRVYLTNVICNPGFADYFDVKVFLLNNAEGEGIRDTSGAGGYLLYGSGETLLHSRPLTGLMGVANAVDNVAAWREVPSWPLKPHYAAVYRLEVTMKFNTPTGYQEATLKADIVVDATQAANQARWDVKW